MNDSIQFPGLSPIPPLGIGTWQWGDTLVWGWGKGYAENDAREAYRAGLESGLRLFDTAEVYGLGKSERMIGEFYQANNPKPLVVSKMFPFPWRFSRQQMLRALRASLKRLGLPQLDLYLLHWPWPPVSLESWAESLAEAYQLGLTKAVGISNHSLSQMERVSKVLAKHNVPVAANQIEYNLLQRGPERSGLLAAMQAEGIVAMAYSPLGMGWLTGKYSLDTPPPGRYRSQRYVTRKESLPQLLKTLEQIAQAHGATPAQVALRWCIQKDTLPIPGAKNARQAQGNAGALSLELSKDEMIRLDFVSA
ncbi:MAG: aldo/keto reductase [Thermaceae bacterium]|nr:aldo/keto reductase [Thermaceae bacterium]